MIKENMQEKKKLLNLNKYQIFSVLFDIYLFILMFDPMRESIDLGVINSLVSAMRDLLILFLVAYVILLKKEKVFSIYIFLMIISFVIMILLSMFTSINKGKNIGLIYGVVRGFLICYVVINLPNFYCFGIKHLSKYVPSVALFDFLITLFIFFIKPDLITKRQFGFRICVGNPSMLSVLYVCAFAFCLYYEPFRNRILNLFVTMLLLLAAVATVTSTAFIAIGVVFVLTFFNKKYTYKWGLILGIGTLFILLLIVVLHVNLISFYKLFLAKFDEVKIVVAKYLDIESSVKSDYHSFDIREAQIQRFKDNLEFSSIFFGDGIFSMYDQYAYMIENTYIAIFRDFGILGILVFAGFTISKLQDIYAIYRVYGNYCQFVELAIILVFCMTLYIPAGNSTLVESCLFLYLSRWNDIGEISSHNMNIGIRKYFIV